MTLPNFGCPAAQVDVQRDEYGPVADRAAAMAAQQDLLWPLDAQQSGRAEPKFKIGDRVRDVALRYRPLATVFAVRGNDVKVAWDNETGNQASNSFWPETDFELIADDSAYGGPIPAPDLVDHPPHYTTGPLEDYAPPTTNKRTVLEAAIKTVADRGVPYGGVEDNFGRIAALWRVHMKNRHGLDTGIDASDVASMMILMKLARLENQPKHPDSWVDIAGYAACGGEITA